MYLQTGPTDTHTHTQKKMGLNGSSVSRAGPGYLSRLVRSHRPEPPWWDSNPRPWRCQHQDCRPLNHDHRPLRNRHEHSCQPFSRLSFSLEVGGVSFLDPRLLIGRGVVGRLVVSLPIGWGARGARLPLIGWRKRSMPFLGVEPRSEAAEAPPTPSAKNTWAMATGSSEGRWRCCCCSCSCCKNLTKK